MTPVLGRRRQTAVHLPEVDLVVEVDYHEQPVNGERERGDGVLLWDLHLGALLQVVDPDKVLGDDADQAAAVGGYGEAGGFGQPLPFPHLQLPSLEVARVDAVLGLAAAADHLPGVGEPGAGADDAGRGVVEGAPARAGLHVPQLDLPVAAGDQHGVVGAPRDEGDGLAVPVQHVLQGDPVVLSDLRNHHENEDHRHGRNGIPNAGSIHQSSRVGLPSG